MTARNRIVWSEGLFIKPQHFQQQQRYLEHVIDERVKSAGHFLYGTTELSLNLEYLSFGRIAIERAKGVMPDGSVFNIPQNDVLPEPLDIVDSSLVNQIVYLAIPLNSDSIIEVNWGDSEVINRYKAIRYEAKDVHSKQGDSCMIDVSPAQLKLMLEKEDRSAYAYVAIARILEKRPDGSVVLDENFIPCHLNTVAVPHLHRFIGEVAGLMGERARSIAQRIDSPNQSGVADVAANTEQNSAAFKAYGEPKGTAPRGSIQ